MTTTQRWKHPAMNTVFTVAFADPPPSAAATAGMCFQEIDRLERLLSRYQPDSDISRINQLDSGESLLVDPATHEVLVAALQMHGRTGGLFDISLGHQTRDEAAVPPPQGSFAVNPDRPEVTCVEKGRALDLGGIGKGFALDRVAQLLRELEVESALVSAGASTHLAYGQATWKIKLTGDSEGASVELRSAALSSTGTAIQGSHIVHPESATFEAYPQQRVWVIASTGAEADAFSTACLMLEPSQLRELREMEDTRIRIFFLEAEGKVCEVP